MDYKAVIKTIKANLKNRSGKTWSVKEHKGTSYGWITISATPKNCDEWGNMYEKEQKELTELLGLNKPVHCQGETIPGQNNSYQEYLDRSEGLPC